MCEGRLKLCDYSLIGAVRGCEWTAMVGRGCRCLLMSPRSERPLPGGGDGRQKGTDSEYFGVN